MSALAIAPSPVQANMNYKAEAPKATSTIKFVPIFVHDNGNDHIHPVTKQKYNALVISPLTKKETGQLDIIKKILFGNFGIAKYEGEKFKVLMVLKDVMNNISKLNVSEIEISQNNKISLVTDVVDIQALSATEYSKLVKEHLGNCGIKGVNESMTNIIWGEK